MNFLNIEYFIAAAQELNFTKAAKHLYISPQSLSRHIAKLEAELGVELFNRTHPMSLTYAGRTLFRRANEMIDIKRQTEKELCDIKSFYSGELSIGISHTRGRVLLPKVLPVFHEKFPNIDLKLTEGNTHQLDSAFINGDIDLMIGMLPFSVEGIESIELCKEDILIIVPDKVIKTVFPDTYDIVKKRLEKSVDFELLANCPFLMMNTSNRVRTIADEMLASYKIKPKIILETENIETLLALCCCGMGITFYPEMFISKSCNHIWNLDGINIYPLEYDKTHGVLGIGYHKKRYLPKAAVEFIKILKTVI